MNTEYNIGYRYFLSLPIFSKHLNEVLVREKAQHTLYREPLYTLFREKNKSVDIIYVQELHGFTRFVVCVHNIVRTLHVEMPRNTESILTWRVVGVDISGVCACVAFALPISCALAAVKLRRYALLQN